MAERRPGWSEVFEQSMRRTNTFEVVPLSERDSEILHRTLDASAALWNEVTYTRRQRFFNDEDIWDVTKLYEEYKPVLSAATAQTVIRRNDEMWRSFFASSDSSSSPPGYWGNRTDGRELQTYIRNDKYSLEWGTRSRLEIRIGQQLKNEFGLGVYEHLRLEARGRPKWAGKQGRLVLRYDKVDDLFRAHQPVIVPEPVLESTTGEDIAGLDIGVNNLVACTTTGGHQYLYDGSIVYEQFRETSEEISRAEAKLPPSRDGSKRIRALYRKRTRRRDHAIAALVRNLVEHLHRRDVSTLYLGDLNGILSKKRSSRVNHMTHNFWAFDKLRRRFKSVCEEYGIDVSVESEAYTSQTCPRCGQKDTTARDKDSFTCQCGFKGHADLTASENILRRYTDQQIDRPMARPVRFEWNNHQWRSTIDAFSENALEQRTDP
ncbi:MAG: transposase [Halolamina sp.]